MFEQAHRFANPLSTSWRVGKQLFVQCRRIAHHVAQFEDQRGRADKKHAGCQKGNRMGRKVSINRWQVQRSPQREDVERSRCGEAIDYGPSKRRQDLVDSS